MKVILEGFKINQGIEQIYKIVDNNIEYINEFKKGGLLLHSRLFSFKNIEFVETILYKDEKVLNANIQNVFKIDVKIDDFKKKRDVALKKSILIATKNEYKLPWGILTGIRPTKIIHVLMDKGYDADKIYNILQNEYLIREDKIKLLLSICEKQRGYLSGSKEKYSIYIGIPFCPSRCLYCSFPAMNINDYDEYIDRYVDAIIYELKKTKEMMKNKDLNTVYIGGGTPTSLKKEQLEIVIKKCREIFIDITEFTIEAGRPDTLNFDYLKMFKDNNIDRISINPQTMNDNTLKLIGRNHMSKDIVNIYSMAKELGIENINMDLIIGLPNEKYDDIKYTLDQIFKLNPNNLTIHSLALKTGSKFYRVFKDYNIIDVQEAEKISGLIDRYIQKLSLEPYYLYRQKNIVGNLENVGYSHKDNYCKYNISMMEERETIIGIGVGSVSKIVKGDKIKRIPNFKGLDDYLNRLDELIIKKEKYINTDNL